MTLHQKYLEFKAANPRTFARDIAAALKVSEAELMQARVGHGATALQADFPSLLQALESVGPTKTISRNEYAVHEQVGVYENLTLGAHGALVLNPRKLDLRLFLGQWAHAFFLVEETARGETQSLQIFDDHGDAVLKIYRTEQTHADLWSSVIERHTLTQAPELVVTPRVAPSLSASFDHADLERQWRAMDDAHQFFGLLRRLNISRQQAFASVANDLAWRVQNDAVTIALNQAQADGNEIMIFVGNPGCIQVFTGVIEKALPMQGWMNVFNTDFTLHLRADAITETWVTRKPTKDGMVTSLEAFAADGTQVLQLYGQRIEGNPEQEQWRHQVNALPKQETSA